VSDVPGAALRVVDAGPDDAEAVLAFEQAGAEWAHLVDLDAQQASAISSATARVCVLMKTVTPASAWALSRSLTWRIDRGSRPTIGSSTISTLGRGSSAAAKTSRCFIPWL